jgi:hypothetical protein
MGVYAGFDEGSRFDAFEQKLNADVGWVVHMAARTSPSDMRSSVWGQVGKPGAYLTKLSSRINLVMTIPLAFGTQTAKTEAGQLSIGKDLRAVAAGRFDDDFRAVAQQLIAGGYGDSVIRLGHEFDGDFYPWSARGNNEAYIAAFRHVHDVFATESAAFRFEWTGFRNSFAAHGPAAYPGDAYVDIVGLDIYYRESVSMSDEVWSRQYQRALEFHRDFAISRGKPVAYSEWAAARYDNPEFIDAMHQWFSRLPASGPGRLLYQSYFTPPRDGYDMSEFPKTQARYFALFGGTGGRAPSPAELSKPTPAPTTTTPAPTTTTPAPTTTTPAPTTTTPAPTTTTPAPGGGSPASGQFTVFDQRVVHQVDRYADLDVAQLDWNGTANLVQGTPLLRLDIVDKPTDRPVQVLVCMWQKGFAQETCVSVGTFNTTGEHWVILRSPGSWWRKGQWDWSAPIDHVRLMVKDQASGSLLTTRSCGAACFRGAGNAADHAPITFDTEMVIVAKGGQLAADSVWAGCPASFQRFCSSTTQPPVPPTSSPGSEQRPAVSVRAAAAKEGKPLRFRISLSAISTSVVSVLLRTENLSAVAGRDYRPVATTVTIPAGERVAWIGIATIKDRVRERAEQLRLSVFSVSDALFGNRSAIGTIRD